MKNPLYILLILLLGISSGVSAQDFTSRKDLSKKERKKYKKAVVASRAGEADKAIKHFDEVLKSKPNFVEAYLRKGSIFYGKGKYEQAKASFLKAISIAPEFDPEMYFSAALTLYEMEQFDKAAYHFESYLERNPNNQRKVMKATKLLGDSKFSHTAMKNPVPFNPVMLSDSINSAYSEYTPVLSIDGQSLVFTRRVGTQEDFYTSHVDSNGSFTKAVDMPSLNTAQNEGAHTLSADGKVMIFTACDRRDSYGGCDLYYTRYKSGAWIEPRNLGPIINSPAWESQPALSADGQILYFTSNRKGGLGGKDIWRSVRAGDRNGWTTPVNMGETINSIANDESPFIHADGYTLYFRSDGHPGMGDFDMYLSRRDGDDDHWSAPVNLGYPINTKGNEGALSVSLDGSTAYFASDAAYLDDLENANLDIYSFEMPKEIRPRLATYLRVSVVDAVTKASLQSNQVILADGTTGDELSKYVLDAEGTFTTSLPVGATYAISIEKPDYLFQSLHIDLDSVKTQVDPYQVIVEMIPVPKKDTPTIVYDKPVILNNIFFESGSATLKDVSMIEINRLAKTLKELTSLKIRILGHTDNIGDDQANKKLSEARAKSVYTALVTIGIQATRLSYIGVGEADPIDSNETPEGRQRNRRTEFILIR